MKNSKLLGGLTRVACLSILSLMSMGDRVQAGALGVNVEFNQDQLGGQGQIPDSMKNKPLYNFEDTVYPWQKTWNVWAEQLGASGVEFVCCTIRGTTPNTLWSNPNDVKYLVNALKTKKLDTKIKLAIFDDNAASWAGQKGGTFDCADTSNYKYIWDQNYKPFYQQVPDSMRFKVNGRPYLYIYTGNIGLVNQNGNLSKILTYVRQQCQSTFGFNPFIVVPNDWIQNDPSSNNQNIIDGVHGWFGMDPNSKSKTTWNGTTISITVPGFYQNNGAMRIDPNHGATFRNNLSSLVSSSTLTIVEGFTDVTEACSSMRTRNLDGANNPVGYSVSDVDYPNQRINILRQYSSNPFPSDLKEEIENCDTFGGASGGAGFYRRGAIMVENTTDESNAGYDVGNIQPNEWFEWQEVPMQGTVSLNVRVATTVANCKIHFVIDGSTKPTVTLPNTGGWQTWTTVNAGTFTFASGSRHTVRLVCETAGMNLNWWQLGSGSSSSGVVFYQDTGYGGTASQSLAKGTYTLSQLAAKGCPNDWASSARIPSGWTLIMYADDNFAGTSWTRTADTPSFIDLSPNANDMMSSCKIQ